MSSVSTVSHSTPPAWPLTRRRLRPVPDAATTRAAEPARVGQDLKLEVNNLPPKTKFKLTVTGADGKPETRVIVSDAKGTATIRLKTGDTFVRSDKHRRGSNRHDGHQCGDHRRDAASARREKAGRGRGIEISDPRAATPNAGSGMRTGSRSWPCGCRPRSRMPARRRYAAPLRAERSAPKARMIVMVGNYRKLVTTDAKGSVALDIKAGQNIRINHKDFGDKVFKLTIHEAGLKGRERIAMVLRRAENRAQRSCRCRPLSGTVQRWFGLEDGMHKLAFRMPKEIAEAKVKADLPPVAPAEPAKPKATGGAPLKVELNDCPPIPSSRSRSARRPGRSRPTPAVRSAST